VEVIATPARCSGGRISDAHETCRPCDQHSLGMLVVAVDNLGKLFGSGGRPGAPGLDLDNGAGDPMGHRVTSRTTPRFVVRARSGHPASRTPAVRAFRASPVAVRSTSTAITDPGS
jgi:hypothetical protein